MNNSKKYNLIDSHCHLQKLNQIDLNNFLNFCEANSIKYLISAAARIEDWQQSIKISQQSKRIKIALGIHPWYINHFSNDFLNNCTEQDYTNAIAIGEIGLDKINCKIPIELQTKIFEKQLKIARDFELPPIIHCCKAYNELIGSVKKIGLPACGGIIHAYNGSLELTDELLKLGFSFSLGNIFNNRLNEKKILMLKKIYPDNLLLESDYFPESFNNNQGEEKYKILDYLKTAAHILEEDEQKVENFSTELASWIFNI